MERDIRELFETESDLQPLPKNHKAEFQKKLNHLPKEKSRPLLWLKIALVFLIGFVIAQMIFENNEPINDDSLIAEMEVIESQYLKNIETEWQNFIEIANDDYLVKRYETKLEELDMDYQNISKIFKEDPNDIIVLEHLIENLKRRLQLLKDIQKHINLLNQKNKLHENRI